MKKILILFLLLVSLLTYTKEFRVISYNLYGGRLTDPIELADSLKKYSPDFLAFQEVDKETFRSNFLDFTKEVADRLGYRYYYFKKALDFQAGEFGISFISKYPVDEIYTKELINSETAKEKRQLIVAKFNKSIFSKNLCIFNTHLTYDIEDNAKQVDDLLTVATYINGDMKILCGDFNLLPSTKEYKKIVEKFNDTYNNKDEKRIDYIFTSKDPDIKVLDARFLDLNLSDHKPYEVILDIK
ncbi:endonuclease/exonuclease/phosphatase family protein [Sneathia sanguinegens]|uniref:endonuclease/exonuclease/phosphatase family protein n=1 Tax=Sneathia sanguinegens TaxID=40543 RepID=UPI00288BE5EE|nr:endonuclease/exonuclease/phosphatase family protein [Sneathia sanguinegens]